MVSAGSLFPVRFLRRGQIPKLMLAALVAVLVQVVAVRIALAANPPPVQIYYVPAPEDQVFDSLSTIYPGTAVCGDESPNQDVGKPITSLVSLAFASGGTLVYYDHWEDGFEVDVSNPTQSTTEVWGDGDDNNGIRPDRLQDDPITLNTVIVLDTLVNPDTRQAVIDYDGGDKIAATRAIAMTRAAWASGTGTLHAGDLEAYPVDKWGTRYDIPVGENAALNIDVTNVFSYTGLVIMAADDGTALAIDADADSVAEINAVIDEGESYLVNGGVLTGASVTASAPVQVGLITGDRCDNYESRWFLLFPTDQWSGSQYSPVSTEQVSAQRNPLTSVFLYNPGPNNPLPVIFRVTGNVTTTVNVPLKGVAHVTMPANTGAQFFTADGSPFAALGVVDSENDRNKDWDWGFTLVPHGELTRQTLLGWGPGKDPTSLISQNGNPVWVMPVYAEGTNGPVRICVDYNGDDAGPLVDSNGFRYDVLLQLDELEVAQVFDPDGDQTGMLLYVCDLNTEPPSNAALAAAWGPEPSVASEGQPGLDLGTTALPSASFEAGKAADLVNDADGDGLVSPGDSLLYTVVIRNSSRVTVENVVISDTVPAFTAYVTSTTTFDNGTGSAPIPDSGSGTPFPLDDGGVPLGDLPVRGVFTVTFQVVIDNPYLAPTSRVRNVAVVTAQGETVKPEVETIVNLLDIEKLTNGVDADLPPGPSVRVGDPVTWTYLVSSTGVVSLTSIVVTDSVTGVTPVYVSGDVNSDDILDPDEQWLYRATGIAVQGQYTNTGYAAGVTPEGDPAHAQDASHYFGELFAAIEIEKSASAAFVAPGTTVTYTFVVSNVGDAPLHDVVVSDNRCAPVTFVSGDVGADGILEVGELWTYTCSRAVLGPTQNTATVTALDPQDRTVTDDDSAFVDTTGLWLPIVFASVPPIPCPPPDGCPLENRIKNLAVYEAKNRLYVVTRSVDKLLLVNPDTFEILDRADTGGEPWGIAINESTNRVYVGNFASDDVWVYDADTLDVLAKLPVGDQPGLMDILPGQDTVFVLLKGPSRVAIIEGLAVKGTVETGGSGPFGIAVDPINQQVYISNGDTPSLTYLKQENGVWQPEFGAGFLDKRRLFDVAYSPNLQKLYVVNADAQGNWFVEYWKPDPVQWGFIGRQAIPSGGDLTSADVGGAGLAVSVATGNVFNANTGAADLTVLDGTSDAVLATIGLGNDPFPVAIDQTRKIIYVGLRAPGRVVKIDDTY